MDEEVGVAAGANTILVRSENRKAAIVVRALTAYTSGFEVEIVFLSREPGGTTQFERWDNIDMSDDGVRLGFAYDNSMPPLFPPRNGSSRVEPVWYPDALWGGGGGDLVTTMCSRNIRVRLIGAPPDALLTIGWSWRARNIEPGSRSFPVPTPGEVERLASAIWE